MKTNTTTAYDVTLSLFRRRLQQAGKIDKRYPELASIAKINPHVVIVKMNTRYFLPQLLKYSFQHLSISTTGMIEGYRTTQ